MAQPIGDNGPGRTAKGPIDIVAYLTAPRSQAPGATVGRRSGSFWHVGRDTLVWAGVALALGLFITAQLQAKPTIKPLDEEYPRHLAQSTIERLEAEQVGLKQEILELRRQIGVQQEEASRTKASLSAISDGLKREQVAAGLVPLLGSGITVTLNDSSVKSVPVGDKPDNYLVHEYFIRDVFNVLWANGAEAVVINGERVVGTTSVYCVGSTILVNDTRMSPPYVVQAIGDAEGMAAGLGEPAVLMDLKDVVAKYGIQFKIEPTPEITAPAYTGTLYTKYAQPSAGKPKG